MTGDFKSFSGGGRGTPRDLFPLPHLESPTSIRSLTICRKVRRRLMRRKHVIEEANLAVSALNSLYLGFDPGVVQTCSFDCLSEIPQGQRETLRFVVARVFGTGGPPLGARCAGALKALRVASSPYAGDTVGIGDVVSMNLESLSIPVMGKGGVEAAEILQGRAGECLRDPHTWMLQDAGNWSWLSDESAKIRTYDDPKLRDKSFYREFLGKLYGAGVLQFTRQAVGRVGCFTVSKKPKEVDGVLKTRQRLILDCRRVNLVFRAPPVTELGSLPAVCDLHIPNGETLYISGGDIKDCFYACNLPSCLRDYFCLSWDVTVWEMKQIMGDNYLGEYDHLSEYDMISPCISVFPMGFSWSFYLVQALHVQGCLSSLQEQPDSVILDSRPAPQLSRQRVVSMPYCNNTHALSLQADVAEHGREKLERQLESWGFEMHEQMSSTSYFPTLGGIIDGEVGIVKPTAERFWNLKYVFNHILHHPVSSDMIRRLLGHAMVVLVLNRAGMGIFRAMYDFAGLDFQKRHLWDSAKRECRIFVGLLPLLVGDMRREWSDTVTCTDASPEGFGICERRLDMRSVSKIGRWHERWRYKRTPVEQWQPRERALGWDPLKHLNTARGDPDAFEWGDTFSRNEDFEEVPHEILHPTDWELALNGQWKHTQEHITLKEARCLCLAVRRLCRTSKHRGKRHLILVDNLALAFSMGKGRSCNHGMLRVAQKIGALALAANLCLRIRWIPSELNVSDAPSRGAATPGYYQDGEVVREPFSQWKGLESKARDPRSFPRISQEGEGGFLEAGEGEDSSQMHERSEDGDQSEDRSGLRDWEEGSEWEVDNAGEEQCELRATGAVPALPWELQGLLSGEQVEISPEEGRRCRPRRLLRRVVPRREDSFRRGKDPGSLGVPFPWPERLLRSKPEGFERMEKAETSKVPVATSEACSIRYGDASSSSSREGNGPCLAAELRCVPEAWGDLGTSHEEFGASCQGNWEAIPALHTGSPRRGGRSARQDRYLQQFSASGQPGDNAMAGTGHTQSSEEEESRPASVQHQCRKVPEKVPTGRKLAWLAKSSHLPASTWRRLRRLRKRSPRSPWSQSAGEVENRLLREEVRQVWQGPGAHEQDGALGSPILQEVPEQDGSCDHGPCNAPEHLGWKEACSPCFLEIFSGCGRLHRAVAARGFDSFGIDNSCDPADDVLDPKVEKRIIDLLMSGVILMVWLGMPCTTFSIARRNDGFGPGPLRNEAHPMGLPWIKGRDRAKLLTGNELFFFSMRIICVCLCLRIPVILENPKTSRCWLTPILRQLLEWNLLHITDLDFCQYGERWKKSTRLAASFIDLRNLGRCCKGTFLQCSYSGKRHIHLKGTDNLGRFMTLVAQPYPFKLCDAVADLISKNFHKLSQSAERIGEEKAISTFE